jgi:hypothetical protein
MLAFTISCASGCYRHKSECQKLRLRTGHKRVGTAFIVSKLDEQILTIQLIHHSADTASLHAYL